MPLFIIDDVYGDQRPGQNSTPTFLPSTLQWDLIGAPPKSNGVWFKVPINALGVEFRTWHTVTVNPSEPVTTINTTFVGTLYTTFSPPSV